jgi:hypothetical protein
MGQRERGGRRERERERERIGGWEREGHRQIERRGMGDRGT